MYNGKQQRCDVPVSRTAQLESEPGAACHPRRCGATAETKVREESSHAGVQMWPRTETVAHSTEYLGCHE